MKNKTPIYLIGLVLVISLLVIGAKMGGLFDKAPSFSIINGKQYIETGISCSTIQDCTKVGMPQDSVCNNKQCEVLDFGYGVRSNE